MSFQIFADKVRLQFNNMAKQPLFVVNISKDTICDTYLSSYPEGTNPIFRERTENDCQTCRQFLKNIGNVVSIVDNKLITVWDVVVPEPYQTVANALAALVRSSTIRTAFLSKECSYGKPTSLEITDDAHITWHHLSAIIPSQFVDTNKATTLSGIESTVQVFSRGLAELTTETLTTVLELIDQNSLYRGAEFRRPIAEFLAHKQAYSALNDQEKSIYVWSQYKTPAARIRNTAIGTLLQDLSEGRELEQAVRAYEQVVAPSNYKRPTSLITPAMITKATETIEALGIEPSLHRRFATLADISINNVLFANNASTTIMKDSLTSMLMATAKKPTAKLSTVEEITIEDFITNVVPTATSIQALVANSLKPNFVSLVAPIYESAPNILKWDNNFSWSYNGNITDSMKQNVKAAGGKIDGDLRFSIQWNDNQDNGNDLDAHCIEPDRYEIYYGSKRQLSPSKGTLDVDIITPGNKVAVENITYETRKTMKPGTYKFFVRNFSGTSGRNFTAEIEFDGVIHSFAYEGRTANDMHVAKVHYDGVNFTITPIMKSSQASSIVWNVPTETYQEVTSLMLSPNYWDDQSYGNKHYFFMLDGCTNPEQANGFYNEFLSNSLTEHKKVFEVLSSKLKCPLTTDQLSGLGFSSTQRNELVVKVTGSFTRTLKIKF